jgi:hypothetical protein
MRKVTAHKRITCGVCTYIILESYIALMSKKYFGLYIILGFALPEIVFILHHCMLPSSRNASLDHCCFLKTSNLLPIHHYGILSLRHIFAFPLSLNGWQTSSIWSSRDAYLKLALLNLDDNHHMMSSFHGLYEISLVMHIHDTIHNPYRQHQHTYVMG